MNAILDKYLTSNEVLFVKKARLNKVEELVLFLNNKNFNFIFDKDRFIMHESYLAYTLIAYNFILGDIEKFTEDKIDLIKFKKNINILSDKLNVIQSDLIITSYKNNTFIKKDIFRESLQIINNTSFSILNSYIGNISILNYINKNETIHNHTEDFHINTIFTDYIENSKIQNAEILIHESAHLYFNIFLESNNIILDTSKLYLDAPWKSEIKRHERGFLHGVFAFSTVLSFYKELARNNQDFSLDEIKFINSYIDFREKQIVKVKQDAINVLKKYPKNLENLILEILEKVNK